MTAFPEQGFEILNKKQLDFILSLLRSCITNDSFIVNKGNWWLESRSGGANVKNVRLTLDCLRGFKLKAINHKINSCQTYIRHFGRFSILAKVFKTRISIFAFFSSWSLWEILNSVSHHSVILVAVLFPLAYA